jgi:hypothetical protein
MNTPFRLLITGSRTWGDPVSIRKALTEVLEEHPDTVLVSGHCPGKNSADAIFERELADLLGLTVEKAIAAERIEIHPADWGPPDRKDKGAGFRRDAEMVTLGADLCLTAIAKCGCPRRAEPHGTHGSVDCATKAEAAGIPVRHIRRDVLAQLRQKPLSGIVAA